MADSRDLKLYPSLLACDFARLGDEARRVVEAGADGLHFDVMDGHFVDNISVGPGVLAALRAVTQAHLDVHLMIQDPARYLDPFLDAGADTLTFHLEVAEDPLALVRRIRDRGRRAGIALNPDTPADGLLPLLPEIDLALVMTVRPGFGGQGFIEDMVDKVRAVRSAAGPDLDVEVDGGITDRTAPEAWAGGANVLVAGTYVFRAPDPAVAMGRIREGCAAAGRRTAEGR